MAGEAMQPDEADRAAVRRPLQGVVAVILRDDRFLVIRRSQFVRAPGCYCFPGGGIEDGEPEEVALVRELREELNVVVTPRRRLWKSTTPWGVQLAWWHAELDSAAVLQPNLQEVESVHWLRGGEMLELAELLESNRHFLAVHSAVSILQSPPDGVVGPATGE